MLFRSINSLLSFDGFFIWYFNLKESVDHDAPLSEKEAHALKNCQAAIDMMEIFERSSIPKHGSFMPHGVPSSRQPAISLRSATSGAIASLPWSCRMLRRSASQSPAARVARRCRARARRAVAS